MYTVRKFLKDIERKTRSTPSLDPLGLTEEAVRNLLLKVNPNSTKRRAFIENALYDQVTRYKAPADLKGKSVIQIYPANDRSYMNASVQTADKLFDRYQVPQSFAVEKDSGLTYLKLNQCYPISGRTIHDMNSLTDNGSWNVGANVNTLSFDKLKKITGAGSLRFNIDSSGLFGYLENTTMLDFSISDFMQVGSIFTWVDIPNRDDIVSITLKMQSSPADYILYTVQAPHDSESFTTGWNLLKFPLDFALGLQVVGSPDYTKMNGIRLEFQTTGTDIKNLHVDNIVVRSGVGYMIQYYSSYLFSDPITGEWRATPLDDSDVINVDDDEYQILVLEGCSILVDEAQKPTDIADKFEKKLKEAYEEYTNDNKSEAAQTQTQWYNPAYQKRRF